MAASLFAVCFLLLGLLGPGTRARNDSDVNLGASKNTGSSNSINLKSPELPPTSCIGVTGRSDKIIRLSSGREVLCDTVTDGGGWVVFQRRVSGYQSFKLIWIHYKAGFGSYSDSFWLGLDEIHRLTTERPHELRVDFTFGGVNYYAKYSSFKVLSEAYRYRLQVGGYSGNAGDSLIGWHNGMAFSTIDVDNDIWFRSCTPLYHGGWWYGECHTSNLNGLWGSTRWSEGLNWYSTTGYYGSATFTEMKIRPID